MASTTMAIWFQLCDAKGEPLSGIGPDKVSLSSANSDIVDLRDAVLAKWEGTQLMQGVASGQLRVYKEKAALDNGTALDPRDKVKDLQETEQQPLLIVLPERVPPTTSWEISGLTTRLKAFSRVQLVGDCIQSQDRTPLPYVSNSLEKMYVRKCYEKVFDLFLSFIGQDKKMFAISGTPSIGKSMFFVYILYRLMKDLSLKTLVLQPNRVVYHVGFSYYCFDLQQQRATIITKEQAEVLVFEQDTFYVIDGRFAWLPSDCVTLYISSPHSEVYQDFVKQMSPKTWYLPVWSLDELETCRGQCYMDLPFETLEDRYLFCGGVARFVFHSDYDVHVKGKIESALIDVNAVQGVRYVWQTTDIFPVSHTLMHILVGNEEDGKAYLFTDLAVASKYIGEQLWIRHSAQMITNIQNMYGRSPPDISTNLYETYGHLVLSVGERTLECRCLENDSKSVFKLQAFDGKRTTFRSDTALTAGDLVGKYYEPTDEHNFPAIDSLSSQGMFQFTVASTHPIRRVDVLRKLCKLYDKPRLYFVVPPHRYDDFKKQEFKATKGNAPVQPIPGLEQYVLKLSAESESITRMRDAFRSLVPVTP